MGKHRPIRIRAGLIFGRAGYLYGTAKGEAPFFFAGVILRKVHLLLWIDNSVYYKQ